METQDEVTCANTSALQECLVAVSELPEENVLHRQRNSSNSLRSPETHLLDDDWERLVLYWSRTKNVVRSMSSSSIFKYYILASYCTMFM